MTNCERHLRRIRIAKLNRLLKRRPKPVATKLKAAIDTRVDEIAPLSTLAYDH
jgi:hypothetical protein